MSRTSDFWFGKWILGVLASVFGAILIYFLLDQEIGLLRPTPTATPPAPHAPPLQIPEYQTPFSELMMTVVLQAGERKEQKMADLWNAPAGSIASCADGTIYLSWLVREPYPRGDDFQILLHVPRNENYLLEIAAGAQGNISLGYCDVVTLINNSITTYKVEFRYASAE